VELDVTLVDRLNEAEFEISMRMLKKGGFRLWRKYLSLLGEHTVTALDNSFIYLFIYSFVYLFIYEFIY
jgi:hypothetical protein